MINSVRILYNSIIVLLFLVLRMKSFTKNESFSSLNLLIFMLKALKGDKISFVSI